MEAERRESREEEFRLILQNGHSDSVLGGLYRIHSSLESTLKSMVEDKVYPGFRHLVLFTDLGEWVKNLFPSLLPHEGMFSAPQIARTPRLAFLGISPPWEGLCTSLVSEETRCSHVNSFLFPSQLKQKDGKASDSSFIPLPLFTIFSDSLLGSGATCPQDINFVFFL